MILLIVLNNFDVCREYHLAIYSKRMALKGVLNIHCTFFHLKFKFNFSYSKFVNKWHLDFLIRSIIWAKTYFCPYIDGNFLLHLQNQIIIVQRLITKMKLALAIFVCLALVSTFISWFPRILFVLISFFLFVKICELNSVCSECKFRKKIFVRKQPFFNFFLLFWLNFK